MWVKQHLLVTRLRLTPTSKDNPLAPHPRVSPVAGGGLLDTKHICWYTVCMPILFRRQAGITYRIEFDVEDAALIYGRTWCVQRDGNTKYAYAREPGEGASRRKKDALHRLITNAPRGVAIDHVDGNGLNNRRSNLRLCSNAQNQWNTGPQRNNTTGFKGVYLAPSGKYYAQVKCGPKRHTKYGFSDAEAASKWRNEKAKVLHGAYFKES